MSSRSSSPPVVRIALYRRVSTSQQADKDLSLPEQAAQQRAFVAAQGAAIVADFEDAGLSGTSAKGRPAFQEMVAAAKRGEFDIILVHKSDRAFRNSDEASYFRVILADYGVEFRSVTEPWFGSREPSDKLLRAIMEGMSEFYVDNLRGEIKKGLRSAAHNKGRQNGTPPYGYRFKNLGTRGSGWEEDPQRAPALRRLFERYAEGDLTLVQITRWVNAEELPAPNGYLPRVKVAGWGYKTLRDILQNRVYLGLVHHDGQWYPGAHPALIEEEMFEEVQRLFAIRQTRRERATGDGVGLFSGSLIACPHCYARGEFSGLHICGTTAYRGKSGRVFYLNYICETSRRQRTARNQGTDTLVGTCPGFSITETVVRRMVEEVLRSSLLFPVGGTEPAPLAKWKTAPKNRPETAIQKCQAEIERLSTLRQAFQMQQASGFMTMEELGERLAALEIKRTAQAAEIARLHGAVPAVRPKKEVIQRLLDVLTSGDVPRLQKRDEFHAHFEAIVPSADKSGCKIVFRDTPPVT